MLIFFCSHFCYICICNYKSNKYRVGKEDVKLGYELELRTAVTRKEGCGAAVKRLFKPTPTPNCAVVPRSSSIRSLTRNSSRSRLGISLAPFGTGLASTAGTTTITAVAAAGAAAAGRGGGGDMKNIILTTRHTTSSSRSNPVAAAVAGCSVTLPFQSSSWPDDASQLRDQGSCTTVSGSGVDLGYGGVREPSWESGDMSSYAAAAAAGSSGSQSLQYPVQAAGSASPAHNAEQETMHRGSYSGGSCPEALVPSSWPSRSSAQAIGYLNQHVHQHVYQQQQQVVGAAGQSAFVGMGGNGNHMQHQGGAVGSWPGDAAGIGAGGYSQLGQAGGYSQLGQEQHQHSLSSWVTPPSAQEAVCSNQHQQNAVSLNAVSPSHGAMCIPGLHYVHNHQQRQQHNAEGWLAEPSPPSGSVATQEQPQQLVGSQQESYPSMRYDSLTTSSSTWHGCGHPTLSSGASMTSDGGTEIYDSFGRRRRSNHNAYPGNHHVSANSNGYGNTHTCSFVDHHQQQQQQLQAAPAAYSNGYESPETRHPSYTLQQQQQHPQQQQPHAGYLNRYASPGSPHEAYTLQQQQLQQQGYGGGGSSPQQPYAEPHSAPQQHCYNTGGDLLAAEEPAQLYGSSYPPAQPILQASAGYAATTYTYAEGSAVVVAPQAAAGAGVAPTAQLTLQLAVAGVGAGGGGDAAGSGGAGQLSLQDQGQGRFRLQGKEEEEGRVVELPKKHPSWVERQQITQQQQEQQQQEVKMVGLQKQQQQITQQQEQQQQQPITQEQQQQMKTLGLEKQQQQEQQQHTVVVAAASSTTTTTTTGVQQEVVVGVEGHLAVREKEQCLHHHQQLQQHQQQAPQLAAEQDVQEEGCGNSYTLVDPDKITGKQSRLAGALLGTYRD